MTKITQRILSPGTYLYGGREIKLDRDTLAKYVANTNSLLRHRAVPLLDRHTPIGSCEGGPVPIESRERAKATDTIGWVESFAQADDGSLVMTADVLREDAIAGYESGTIRTHSPEMARQYLDAVDGTQYGPVIRHVAATGTPRVPDQSDIEIVADDYPDIMQLSDDNKIETEDTKMPNTNVSVPTETPVDEGKMLTESLLTKLGLYEAERFDVVLSADQIAKLKEAVAIIESARDAIEKKEPEEAQLADEEPAEKPKEEDPNVSKVKKIADAAGVAVADDTDVLSTVFMVGLLEKLVEKLASEEQEDEAKETQFDDLNPELQTMILDARKIKQEAAKNKIKDASIPTALREKLLGGIQFDDAEQRKQYSATEVLDIVEECVPQVMLLDDSATAVLDPPETVADEKQKEVAEKYGINSDPPAPKPWSNPQNPPAGVPAPDPFDGVRTEKTAAKTEAKTAKTARKTSKK